MIEWFTSFLNLFTKFGPATRSFSKFLLHNITGKCELERISDYQKYDFNHCQDIEYALYHSKDDNIRKILVSDSMKVKDAMQSILRVKRIVPQDGLIFLTSMPKFLRKIISYNKLFCDVDELKLTKYDEENSLHEDLLYRLWTLLKEGDDLKERYTKRWQEIGFQGNNPATDFRGMGVLSLKNMIYLLEKRKNVGLKIFGLSNHPSFGFSFAIVAINFTGTAYDYMKNGKLKGYMYNLPNCTEYGFENFQDFFCDMFLEFAEYWVMREPPNIMSFNEIKADYIKEVNRRLEAGKWSID